MKYPFVVIVLIFIMIIAYHLAKRSVSSIIPKKIFQTHKSLEYVNANNTLSKAVASWKRWSGYEHHFYDNAMCDAFMKEHYQGTDVYKAYASLTKPVMRADFWRYCVLYEFGGIYADCDTICEQNPDVLRRDHVDLVVVPEPSFLFCQWVFAAPPRSPVLKSVIDLMVYRVLYPQNDISEKEYGRNWVYYFTGPMLFTDAIQAHLKYTEDIDYAPPTNGYHHRYASRVHVITNKHHFHKHVVKHLYTGSSNEGWKTQHHE